MQIQFDPKSMDMAEATIVLGMVFPAFVKGCQKQGDTLDEIQAAIAELVSHTWAGIVAAKDRKGD